MIKTIVKIDEKKKRRKSGWGGGEMARYSARERY